MLQKLIAGLKSLAAEFWGLKNWLKVLVGFAAGFFTAHLL